MDYRPFELIRLIRDRVATNARDLEVSNCAFNMSVGRLVDALVELDLITKSSAGELRPKPQLSQLFRKLDLSLNHLANYCYGSTCYTSVFGQPELPAKKARVFVAMPFEKNVAICLCQPH